MVKASEVWTSVFNTLRDDFTDLVNYAVYDFARTSGSRDFTFSADELAKFSDDRQLKEFMIENSVPNCIVHFFMRDEYHYDFTIDGLTRKEFDWNVSDEIALKHVDDYEISKDEMYEW